MTRSGGATARYPAPGSPVPGAPPPLKRALTPADGTAVGGNVSPDTPARTPDSPRREGGPHGVGERGARLTAAAAMVGIAAGLELAGVLARRSKGVKR
ncbi:hypothetical protein ACQI4L_00390 [Mycolicibacterium litorale]|uniref:hypothetical protein n=1 Tax=Mycolicibacterium litorale TaxID=758802 RepID=UPI003CE9129F